MNEKLTLPQLKNLCKDRGIKGYSKLNKKELILLIDNTLSNKDENTDKVKETKTSKDKSDKDEIIEKVKETKTSKDKSDKDEITEKVKETKTSKDKSDKDEITEKVKETKTIKDKSEEKINEMMGKTITEHYKLKDDKSDKFWEIIYEDIDNEKKKYKVKYGKEGTDGTYSKIKEDTLKNIQKIIISKEKKGYVHNK
jgi:predicted DNA-binding WGR domain protein